LFWCEFFGFVLQDEFCEVIAVKEEFSDDVMDYNLHLDR
jgi:hypothetical protein